MTIGECSPNNMIIVSISRVMISIHMLLSTTRVKNNTMTRLLLAIIRIGTTIGVSMKKKLREAGAVIRTSTQTQKMSKRILKLN